MSSIPYQGDSDIHSYSIMKAHHDKAFECVSRAVGIEEKHSTGAQKFKAINWYQKGIVDLEKVSKFNITHIDADNKLKAERLASKATKNLIMAKDRLSVLELEQKKLKNELTTKSKTSQVSANRDPPRSSRSKSPARTPLIPNKPSVSRSHSMSPRPTVPNTRPTRISNCLPKIKPVPGIDAKLQHQILDQMLDRTCTTVFDDIIGLENAKRTLEETVIQPLLRPELFTGLRAPVQGILLFGPPGNGKTMLARALAAESSYHFFNISAAAVTSKWVGESEKIVKVLFALARQLQPSVIFIDEVDSILCERKENDNESARRLKTEFLVQFDGIDTNADDRLLVMGATNRPFDLDDAILRRFPKRICIPSPDEHARRDLVAKLLKSVESVKITPQEIGSIAKNTEGYSAHDLTHLCKDAAMGPIRDMPRNQFKDYNASLIRPVMYADFEKSLSKIRPSCKPDLVNKLEQFNEKYGDVSSF